MVRCWDSHATSSSTVRLKATRISDPVPQAGPLTEITVRGQAGAPLEKT